MPDRPPAVRLWMALLICCSTLLVAACEDDGPPVVRGVFAKDDHVTVTGGEPFDLLANDRIDGRRVRVVEGDEPANASLTFETSSPWPFYVDGWSPDGRMTTHAPPGTWRWRYRICELVPEGQTARCATATAEVHVVLGPLQLTDDTLTAWHGGPPVNVLDNDIERLADGTTSSLISGRDTVVEPVGTLPAALKLSPSGDLTLAEGSPPGSMHRFEYRVCPLEGGGPCAQAKASVTVAATTRLSMWTPYAFYAQVGSQNMSWTELPNPFPDSTRGVAGEMTLAGTGQVALSTVVGSELVPGDPFDLEPGRSIDARSLGLGGSWGWYPPDGSSVTLRAGSANWAAAHDATGQVRAVSDWAAIYPYFDYLPEIPPAEPNTRAELLAADVLVLRFSDGSMVASLSGATLRLKAGGAGVAPADLPASARMLRYDATANVWRPGGTAQRLVVGGDTFYEGPIDRPGVWAIGRIVPATKLHGCVRDTHQRPVPAAEVVALGPVVRSVGRTDDTGRFTLVVPQGLALDVASAPRATRFGSAELQRGVSLGPLNAETTLTDCLPAATLPPLTLNFQAALIWIEHWGVTAVDMALDAPNGSRSTFAGPIAQPLIGTYRLYHARTKASDMDSTPPLVIAAPGRPPERVEVARPLDGEPGFWHLVDIDVATDCSVTVHRVGAAVDALPPAAATAGRPCRPP